MKCSVETACDNPHLEKVNNQVFCFNCYGLYESGVKKKIFEKNQCCDEPNILKTIIQNICRNCGNLEIPIINEPSFLENDEYQTNILYKSKKVHVPYKYLKIKFPEIKFEKIYDFILESIQYIQDFYKLKRKPYTKYVRIYIIFIKKKIPIFLLLKILMKIKT